MDLTLIIFAALALFLSYRLFNVLGTKGGHEPEEHERPVLRPVGAGDAANDQPTQMAEQERPSEPLPEWATPIAEAYPGFDPKNFLEGAASAYEMVVQSFADGDLSNVRSFVAPEVLQSFDDAIETRSASQQTVSLTFVGVETPEVLHVDTSDGELCAELRFRSEQVRFVKDAEDGIIEGSDTQVLNVEDRWVFSRPLRSNDPNWTLVATHGSA